MKTTDIIRRAGRNLRRAKLRTILTSVAIAVGGFAIMVSLMAGEGARQYVDRVLSANMDPKSVMITNDKLLTGMSSGSSYTELREYNPDTINQYGADFKAMTAEDIDKLKKRSELENVSPLYQITPKYISFGAVKDKKYIGQVMMRDSTLRVETVAGKKLAAGVRLADDEVAIPESYLEALGVSANDVINTTLTITVTQMPQSIDQTELSRLYQEKGQAAVTELIQPKTVDKQFKIVSVNKKSPDQMMSAPYAYINETAAKQLTDFTTKGTDMYQKYLMVRATVKGESDPQAVKESLQKEGYFVSTAKDVQGILFTFVNILQGIVMGFGVLALVVSVFGIVNTMYISVLERTSQIGLMKALGASRRDVARLFRYEAAWVGFLGGALGVLLAWGGATMFNPLISEKLGLGEHYLLIFQPLMAVLVIVVLMLVAIVAGWLPSRKAAKLDPIEALRTE